MGEREIIIMTGSNGIKLGLNIVSIGRKA